MRLPPVTNFENPLPASGAPAVAYEQECNGNSSQSFVVQHVRGASPGSIVLQSAEDPHRCLGVWLQQLVTVNCRPAHIRKHGINPDPWAPFDLPKSVDIRDEVHGYTIAFNIITGSPNAWALSFDAAVFAGGVGASILSLTMFVILVTRSTGVIVRTNLSGTSLVYKLAGNAVGWFKLLWPKDDREEVMSRVADHRARRAMYDAHCFYVVFLPISLVHAYPVANYYMAADVERTRGTVARVYARDNEFVPLAIIGFFCGLFTLRIWKPTPRMLDLTNVGWSLMWACRYKVIDANLYFYNVTWISS